jgi:hypothetical protein
MDWRYGPYPEQFAVVYVDNQGRQIWLPVVSPRGHAGYYSTGRQAVHWTHRVNGEELRSERMKEGTRRLTAFWAHKHGVDLRDATFLILVRHLKKVNGWEKGMLRQQCEQPWVAAGTAQWSDGIFTLNMAGFSNSPFDFQAAIAYGSADAIDRIRSRGNQLGGLGTADAGAVVRNARLSHVPTALHSALSRHRDQDFVTTLS